MSLSFQNPAALAALPLAAAPWLLHRWSRSRARPLPFPSLELLRDALRASFASSVLSHRLLLLARTLLALLSVLFLARPVFRGGGRMGSGGPLSLVLAVDASASMDARVAGRSALSWAREQAAAFLPSAGSPDRVGLVVFSDRVERTVPMTGEGGRLKEALADLSPTARPSRAAAAFDGARALLMGAAPGNKVLLFLTDAARNGWLSRGPLPEPDPSVDVVIARAPTPEGNAGVAALRPAAAPGEPGRLEVSAWGSFRGTQRGWTFSWEGRPAVQGTVSPGTGSPFTAFSEKPLARGVLSLDPDALAGDDVFYVLPPVETDARVLVVDGAPALAPAADEAYYLSAALDALGRTGLRSKTVLPAALETEPLADWNVLVLLNTAPLPARAADRIRSFVEGGGGLWMTAGDRFDPGPLEPLLPARLNGRLWEKDEVLFPPSAALHPIGKRLAEEEGFEWSSLRVEKAMDASPAPGATVLLAGARGGRPLLVVGTHGRGRTALLTTTMDRDWTNLPSHPVFPVLFREVCLFLSGREAAASPPLTVDQPWEGSAPSGGDLVIERPDGATEAPVLHGERFRYERTDEPGFYTLRSRRDTAPLARVAVNMDRSSGEGDFTPVTPAELKTLLPGRDVRWISDVSSVREKFDELVRGRPMAEPILFLIGALLVLETLALGILRK